jgi:CBS domain containing-hemolysin-like protein
MALLLLYFAIALGVSFLCSIMEAVLLSVTPSYIALHEQRGGRTAERLRSLKDDIDRPLAAILSLNTIAHTVGAMGAGAQAAIVFGQAYLGIISGILTLLILVLSEIIPKTLGALYWRAMVPAVVGLLWPLMWLLWPLVKLSELITGVLSRGRTESSVSREEVAAMAELGTREGVIEEGESRILTHLFRFGSQRAGDIMTPRTVMFTLQEEATVADAMAGAAEIPFSRIPVYGANLDDVTGFVLKDEILLEAARDHTQKILREIKRDLMVVPETMPLPDLFERMLGQPAHIALVVDEYGGTAGLITLEDLVETVLGLEIVDEVDTTEDMQAFARQQWRRRARLLDLVQEKSPGDKRQAAIRLGLTGQHPTDSER